MNFADHIDVAKRAGISQLLFIADVRATSIIVDNDVAAIIRGGDLVQRAARNEVLDLALEAQRSIIEPSPHLAGLPRRTLLAQATPVDMYQMRLTAYTYPVAPDDAHTVFLPPGRFSVVVMQRAFTPYGHEETTCEIPLYAAVWAGERVRVAYVAEHNTVYLSRRRA